MSVNNKSIGFKTLVMMAMVCVFNFRNIINQYSELGPTSISLWLLGTVCYFLPMVLMMGELASANSGKKAGIYSWIESTMGAKYAFFASWTYFFANVFYFTSLLSSLIVYISWALFGSNLLVQGGGMMLSVLGVLAFWLLTFACIRGLDMLSRLAEVAGTAALILSFTFIVGIFYSVFVMGNAPAQEVTFISTLPDFANTDWNRLMTISWLLFAFGGSESIGVYVADTRGGNKTFVRAIVFGALLIGSVYVLGGYAISLTLKQEDVHLADGIFTLFLSLAQQLGLGTWVANLVGLTLTLAGIGGLAVWINSSVKSMFSELPEGLLPSSLTQTDKDGTPVNAFMAQAVLVTILMLLPALGVDSADAFMRAVISMAALNLLVPTAFLILGYINLRLKKNDMPRSFKMSENNTLALGTAVMMLVVFFFSAVITSIPAPHLFVDYLTGNALGNNANPFITLLINFGGLAFYMGAANMLWSRYEKQESYPVFTATVPA